MISICPGEHGTGIHNRIYAECETNGSHQRGGKNKISRKLDLINGIKIFGFCVVSSEIGFLGYDRITSGDIYSRDGATGYGL